MGDGGQKRFEDPIVLVLEGREHTVTELREAGRLLLTKWPLDTSRRRTAMQAVAAALRNDVSAADARRALLDAALEVFAVRSA